MSAPELRAKGHELRKAAEASGTKAKVGLAAGSGACSFQHARMSVRIYSSCSIIAKRCSRAEDADIVSALRADGKGRPSHTLNTILCHFEDCRHDGGWQLRAATSGRK